MEGINQISEGKLISLSEQEVVDCDINGEDESCVGGRMGDAFTFIQQEKGLTTESNYPYTGQEGKCKKSTTPAAKITRYEDVPANNEKALLQAVAHQPVSVAIEAGQYFSVLFERCVQWNLWHGAGPCCDGGWYGAASDGTTYWLALVGDGMGNGWVYNDEEGYCGQGRDMWDCYGSFVPDCLNWRS